jgi:hypothetical protein
LEPPPDTNIVNLFFFFPLSSIPTLPASPPFVLAAA